MLSHTEQNQILQLASMSFGDGYLTKKELVEYNKNANTKVLVEIQSKEIVGFSIVQVIAKAELKSYLFLDENWCKKQTSNSKTIGYRKMTAVKPNSQGTGIGKLLLERGDAFLAKQTKQIFSTVWQSENEAPMLSILQNSGYSIIDTVTNYWSEDSQEKKYKCQLCGEPPCKCSAIILKKELG